MMEPWQGLWHEMSWQLLNKVSAGYVQHSTLELVNVEFRFVVGSLEC